MNCELQAKRGARISENGEGNEGRGEENHAVEAYPDEESSMPPSHSWPKREVRGENGVEMVLSSGTDGDGCSVRQRCSGIGRRGRWLTGVSE